MTKKLTSLLLAAFLITSAQAEAPTPPSIPCSLRCKDSTEHSVVNDVPGLHFKEGEFRIAQFTDLHWDPNSPNCDKIESTIRSVVAREKPDLILLTGDVVTEAPATKGWQSILRICNDLKTPFAITMGNHDPECLSGDEIFRLLATSPYFVGDRGPKAIPGYGNNVLPIQGKSGRTEAVIYLLDSHNKPKLPLYGDYEKISLKQILWYCFESSKYTQEHGGVPLPALAFFHIPLVEYREVIDDPKTYGEKREGVAAAGINSGLFSAFIDMGDVMGVSVGHDHQNDFIGIHMGIALSYGRCTGADAYGSLRRGGRIFRLYEGQRKFDTWVTTDAGREAPFYFPSGLNGRDEAESTYSPAIQGVSHKQHGVAYTYYEGKCKQVDQIAGTQRKKSGTMSNFSIEGAEQKDHFAYEFEALIEIPERGVYRFYTYSDDGSVLYVDGKKVVDNDGGHSARRREGQIALEKGLHHLRLLYFEDYMGQTLEVGIVGRNLPEQKIPNEMLFLPVGADSHVSTK